MINENGSRRNKPERRKDAPSGRQAATHPEHDPGKTNQAPSSLHQGQGPDFPTQDPHLQQRNPGVRNLKKGATHPASEPDTPDASSPRSRHHEPDQNNQRKLKRDKNSPQEKR